MAGIASAWLRVLEPPYAVLEPLGRTEFPFDAILLADVRGGLQVIETLTEVQRRAPWIPVVIAVHTLPADPLLLSMFVQLRGPLAFLSTATALAQPADVCAAILGRPPPSNREIGSFIASRLNTPEFVSTFMHAVQARSASIGSAAMPSYRTLCRRLQRMGPLRPRDWRLLAHLAAARREPLVTLDQLARSLGTETRTLRHQVRRLVGTSLHDCQERLGWEWVLEAALRHHGYLRDSTRVLRSGVAS